MKGAVNMRIATGQVAMKARTIHGGIKCCTTITLVMSYNGLFYIFAGDMQQPISCRLIMNVKSYDKAVKYFYDLTKHYPYFQTFNRRKEFPYCSQTKF